MKANPNKPPTITEAEDDEDEESSLSTFASDDEDDCIQENSISLNDENRSSNMKFKNPSPSRRNGLMNEDKNHNVSQTIIHKKSPEEESSTSCKETGTGKTFSKNKNRNSPKPSQPLPWICLKSGISAKASPYTPGSWVKLSLTLDGRDKITKTIQYASRFLFYYTQKEKWQKLQKSLTNSRKAYRLGRSFVELFKLYNLGVFQHIANISDEKQQEQGKSVSQSRTKLLRKVSSNIGYGVPTYSNYLNWSRRLSTFYRFNDSAGTNALSATATNTYLSWRTMCAMCKLLGLMGFWFGDNVSYLITTGFLESKRKESWQFFAARCYFFGALAGLYANLREIIEHRSNLRESKDKFLLFGDTLTWEKSQSKQFSITVALLKSCCDVLVFSNNAGIDLHKNYRGKKMHEGFHCLCGLVSASTVLYNYFPNAENDEKSVTVSKMNKNK